MIRREALPVTVALGKSKFGAVDMGKIKLVLGASILLLVSAQANASLVGIDILSEEYRVWGSVRLEYPEVGNFSYDLASTNPISFDTRQVDGLSLFPTVAEADYFRVLTDAGGASGGVAYAQSTYTFMSGMTQLSLNAFGEGGGWIASYSDSESIISLLDITTDHLLLSERFGEAPENTPCDGNPSEEPPCFLAPFTYSFDENYLFHVSLDHTYELSLFSLTSGDDNRFGETILQAQLSAVPVPAAIWLFGTGLIGLVGISKRRKAA